MLTRHSAEQLRGFIIALFMPIFFGTAGISTNLAVLAKPDLMWLTLGLIGLASVGKFSGAFLGGRLGGLSYSESLAVGAGMNARGSTEVVVASIGLSLGALNQSLFTSIVAMAVVTTTIMPPDAQVVVAATSTGFRGKRAFGTRRIRGAGVCQTHRAVAPGG